MRVPANNKSESEDKKEAHNVQHRLPPLPKPTNILFILTILAGGKQTPISAGENYEALRPIQKNLTKSAHPSWLLTGNKRRNRCPTPSKASDQCCLAPASTLCTSHLLVPSIIFRRSDNVRYRRNATASCLTFRRE